MKTTILIVEDEGLIALDLKTKLEQAGYVVPMMNDNAVDALLSVERLRPSLVLMDVRLRGPQDGIQAAEEIRQRFQIPVMFVSAHNDRETLDRARITEPFGYIVKPFHNVDFRAQIEVALWRHQMEQKLRASEAWLSITLRNVADALIVTDNEGNIAYLNAPAKMLTGWTLEEAKGKPLLEVFHVFDETTGFAIAHPVNAIYDGLEPGAVPSTLKLFPRSAAEPKLVEASISANRDGDLLLGIIVVFRDITERRNAEEQNRQLQKVNALSLLATGLGSELAESQRFIDDSLAELISGANGGPMLRLLGKIHQHIAHQQAVVQQLTKLGKVDPGPLETLDVNTVVAGMSTVFRKALGQGRSLVVNLDADLVPIRVHPKDLSDSLLRLVADARRAMPDGGKVEISTRMISSAKFPQGVQVAIRDSGKEIRASSKSRVFDPYYQARLGNQKTGLSLALVYQFVALSGGEIEIGNTDVGQGAEYLLTFPAAEHSQPRAEPEIRSATSA